MGDRQQFLTSDWLNGNDNQLQGEAYLIIFGVLALDSKK